MTDPDIYTAHRARIRSRNWNAVHLAGDRNEPVTIWTRPWRKSGEATRVGRGSGS